MRRRERKRGIREETTTLENFSRTFLPGDKSDEMAQTGPIYKRDFVRARMILGYVRVIYSKASPMKVLIGVQEVAAV
jgi:hypothetical protein